MSANFTGILKPPFVIPEIQGWQGYTVLGLIGFMLLALVAELAPPYLVMMGTLVIFLALSILDVDAALHGFADEAMLSVAVLFVVAKGIEQSGGLEYVASVLFRTPDKTKELLPGMRPSKTAGSIVWVLLKFSVPVAIFSAFLANIPLVAMMIPPIVEFGKKVNLPPSKMLMPLSYAAQLGGTMTLIGASTNLVVLSMAAQKLPEMKMNLFEIGIIGVPVTIAGIFYIIAFSGKLLPDRLALQPTTINAREYNVVLVMQPTSSLARKSIEKSGINRQPGLALISIDRDGTQITNPTPDFVLQPKDRMHFVGVLDSVLLLVQLNGLVITEDEGLGQVDLNRLKTTQCLVEAVVASESPMVLKRIADLQFRERYKAAVVAIHRYGTRLSSEIGEIKLAAGDCLLMVVEGPEFVNKHRNNSTFALVAQVSNLSVQKADCSEHRINNLKVSLFGRNSVEDARCFTKMLVSLYGADIAFQLPGFKPINRKKAGIAAVLLLALVVASGVGVKLITAALFSAAGLLITKCVSPRDAMESIEIPVLIMIAAAFGISQGMVDSGAATLLAKALMGLAGKSLFGLVTCTYVATTFFSLAITNSAAVTIMFPVALAAANQQQMDFRLFAYILMMAASAGIMTPTGCPTNLMVYTPGGYRFSDYIFYGGPMQILLLLVTVGITMTAKYWFIWWILITLVTLISIPLVARHKSTHPKPMTAPAPASSPPDAKPSTSESDVENPGAPLHAGNEDSSSFALKSPTPLIGDQGSSSSGLSNTKPSSLQISSPGVSAPPAHNEGSEELSRRTSSSPSQLMDLPSSTFSKELTSTLLKVSNAMLKTSQYLPLPIATSSSSTNKSLVESSSSLPLSPVTPDLLLQPTSRPTEDRIPIFPTPGPLWSASVSISPSPSHPALPYEDTSLPKPSIPIPETPSYKNNSLPNQKTPPSLLVSSIPSTPGLKNSLFNTSLETQITPSPGPVTLPTSSTPISGAFLIQTATLPANITSLHPWSKPMPSLSTAAASTMQTEPSSIRLPMPTTSTSGFAPASKLTASPFQPPTLVTVSEPTPEQGPAVLESASSTPRPGPSLTRTASLPASISPSRSPQSKSLSSPLQTAAASAVRMEPTPSITPLIPVSKRTPPVPGQRTVMEGSNGLFSQSSSPSTGVAFPNLRIPGIGTVAPKRTSLLSEEPPLITPPLTIPVLPGPGTVAIQRASLTPPEPPPPIPVTQPLPSIPGPGTAESKWAGLTFQSQIKRSSFVGQEKRPPTPQPTIVPIQDTSTGAVETALISPTDKNYRDPLMPIVVKTYIPKRPNIPLPTSGSNINSSEIGRDKKKSLTSGSDPSTAEARFFTTPTSSSKPPRRLTPPPWVHQQQLPTLAGDSSNRRPSRILEEDLTGGISDLMMPRRLSSLKDVDAFADRWQGTT